MRVCEIRLLGAFKNYSNHGFLQNGGNDFHIADMATIIKAIAKANLV